MMKVNGKERYWRKGMTVADLLEDMGYSLDTVDLVIIDSQIIAQSEYKQTLVPNSADVRLIPLIVGG
jgi:thiamine biosynthesis protein ThiS